MKFRICPECEVHNTGSAQHCVNCSVGLSANSVLEIKNTQLDWKKVTARFECEEAGQSLKYALIGLICFGLILQPYAIYLGFKALAKISEDPNLTGAWKAWVGILIGVSVLGFTLLSFLSGL